MKLSSTPTAVPNVPGLSALNIDPEQAAHDYRERVVGPYRICAVFASHSESGTCPSWVANLSGTPGGARCSANGGGGGTSPSPDPELPPTMPN